MTDGRAPLWAAVADAVGDPMVVVDEGTVVDANAAFREWFEVGDPAGAPLADVLPEQDGLRERIRDGEADADRDGVVETTTPGGPRSVSVDCNPVTGADGDRLGRVARLHDVTAQRRQRRELERQNERLDQFASLISHDLRNPLDVALGRTNILIERVDDEEVVGHLEEVSDAHSRMQRIITDLLALAREGDTLNERRPVELAAVAEDAWSNVATRGARLTVETERTVSADRDRLVRAFENLFRNAVQHAGPDVSVTVADTEDGFYVADDGPGVAPADRDQVLEAGYSGDDSTGLGLAIVDNIVSAHGWDVTVTEAAPGGARFEVATRD